MNDKGMSDEQYRKMKRSFAIKEGDYVKLVKDINTGIKAKTGEEARVICIAGRHAFFTLEFHDKRVVEVHASYVEPLKPVVEEKVSEEC